MAKKGSRAAIVSSVVESIPIQVVSPAVPLVKEKPVKKVASVKTKASKPKEQKPEVKKQTTKTFKARESKTSVIAIRQGVKRKDISETREKVSAVRASLPPRRNRTKEFVVKIRRMTVPEIKRAHMRVVTYVGVFYILIGIGATSYALTEMHKDPFAFMGTGGVHPAELITATLETEAGTTVSPPPPPSAIPYPETTNSDSETATETITSAASDGTTMTTTSAAPSPTTTTAPNPGTATSYATTTTPTLSMEDLKPKVDFIFSRKAPFNERVEVTIGVRRADKVELGLMPKNGLTTLYLGRAYRVSGSDDEWRFLWDTRHIPNGEYGLAARVTNQYGSYTSAPESVRVYNPVPTTTPSTTASPAITPAVTEVVTTIEEEMGSSLTDTTPVVVDEDVEEEDEEVLEEIPLPPRTAAVPPTVLPAVPRAAVLPPADDIENTERVERDVFLTHLNRFKQRLAVLIERFATAQRAGENDAVEFVRREIETLKQETLDAVTVLNLAADGDYSKLESELDALIAQETTRIEMRERMIVERVGEAIVTDTDSDGIVDYDEVNLYKTDPRVADSDNDGFVDGAEIMSGHNPTDASGEVMIAFENPEVEGPSREDILAVDSISTEFAEAGVAKGARLEGKGLPNSFVTLYVFSTPVVVTVRTADDGSWSYVFDKELEDGSHTVYVGITDNAGRIVAKSKPFPFVKTAEAFTGGPGEVQAEPVVMESPDVLSSGVMLLIAALSLILLGLALVALGAYFMRPLEGGPVPSPVPA